MLLKHRGLAPRRILLFLSTPLQVTEAVFILPVTADLWSECRGGYYPPAAPHKRTLYNSGIVGALHEAPTADRSSAVYRGNGFGRFVKRPYRVGGTLLLAADLCPECRAG